MSSHLPAKPIFSTGAPSTPQDNLPVPNLPLGGSLVRRSSAQATTPVLRRVAGRKVAEGHRRPERDPGTWVSACHD